MAALTLSFTAAVPQARAQTFGADCNTGCHSVAGLTGGRRVNAAGSATVIEAANIFHGMAFATDGSFSGGSYATEIQGGPPPTPADIGTVPNAGAVNYTAWNTATAYVAYGGSVAVPLPNLVLTSGMLNSLIQSGTAVPGVSYSVAAESMTFNHATAGFAGAGGNCTTRVISTRATGPAQTDPNPPGTYSVIPLTSTRTVTVNVNAPSAPVANNDSRTIAYSTGATVFDLSALGSITGTPAATSSTVSLGTLSPNVGTRVATGPDTFTYASSATVYAPQLTLTYSVTGPCSTTSATRTMTINVNAPPAPVVVDGGSPGSPILVPAGIATPINLTGNISGVVASNPAGTYNLVASQPTAVGSGSTSVAGNTVTYTPAGGFTGPTTFTFTKDGPGGTSNTATVYLDVTAAPVVAPTTATTAFNTPVSVNLAAFITSTQAILSVTPSAPTSGAAIATGPTTIQFTPTAGFFGVGTFNYTATNAGGTSAAAATVTVTVNPPPPTVSPTTVSAAFNSGAPVASTTIDLAPFIAPPAATVLSVIPAGAVNGTVVATGPTTVSFTPTAGYIGPASFTYNATNAGGASAAPALVTVNVAAPPAPVSTAFTVLVSGTTPTTFDLAPFISGLYTTVAVTSPATAGSVVLNGTMATYTPLAGFTGTATFIYRATGLGGSSAPTTVTLNYTAAPVTSNRSLVVPFNGTGTIDLTSAFSGIITSYSISRQPANGVLAVNGPIVTYRPNTGFSGADSFQFTATGPGGNSVPGTVSITVNPPVATVTGLEVTVPFGAPATIDLTRAISGSATSFVVTTPPLHGTLVINGTTATYTPAAGYSGPDTFSVAAVNATGTSEPGVIRVTVGTLKPTASVATMSVPLNGTATLDLSPFISGSSITGVAVTTLPTHGIADVAGTSITYTPKTDYFGTDTFQYVAFGNAGKSAPATITVTIVGRPDPTKSKDLVAIVEAQAQSARRFARAQITNIQRRMEALHVPPPKVPEDDEEEAGDDAAATPSAPPPKAAPGPGAPKGPEPAKTSRGNTHPGYTGELAIGASMNPTGHVRTAGPASGTGAPRAPASPGEVAMASVLMGAASSQSVNLAATTGAGGASLANGTTLWLGGLASFGKRNETDDASGLRFSTDGVSVGVDRRLSDRFAAGLAMGYGRERSDIGGDGSRSKTSGGSIAGYASYHPSPNTFVDGLLGLGRLTLDSDRWVDSVEEYAVGRRKGNQLFGSVAAGYEYRRKGVLVSPYGRADFSLDRLKQSTESGAGLNALTFLDQDLRTLSVAAGLRVESQHKTDFGWAMPRLRLEYRHDFENGRAASFMYADQYAGLTYSVTPSGSSRNSLLLGVGSDFLWRNGLKLGFDYQGQRSSGPGSQQAFRFLLSKDLDGKGGVAWPGWAYVAMENPVRIDTGWTFDDNVTRGRDAQDRLSDQVYTLNLATGREYALNKNTRAIVTAVANTDRQHAYTGLGRFSGGVLGEVQYRRSGDFDAVTYGVFGRATYDAYESRLRTGPRYSLGLNARRSLTDRIELFADLSANARYGRSEVFQGRDYAGRFILDYSLGSRGAAYLSGEYRRGDSFSSGRPSLANLGVADVFVQDDAFDGGELFAYRFEAKTLLGTLGYNYPLGPTDSLDISWRRVQTTPLKRAEFDGGASRYNVNQYSILYLFRF